MDRRDFLAGSAAALGALALSRSSRAEDAKPKRRLLKAVKYGMVGAGADVLAKFKLVKKLGFDGIELDSPSDLDENEVLRARDRTALPIHGVVDSVHWKHHLSDPDPKRREKGRKALETALYQCKRYGGSTVLLVPAVVNKKVSYADAWKRSSAEIRKVLPLATELRVAIAIENVWNHFLLSPLEARRYVDQFESKWIGWYFDVGNVVNYGWPEQWIRILGKRILKLDIKDFSRKKRNDEGLYAGFGAKIGDGDSGWADVVKALDDVGYGGWATAEVRGGDEARLKDIAARMERVFGL